MYDLSEHITNNKLIVKVRPNARTSQVLKIENGVIHVSVAAPPESGNANAALEKFVSKLTRKKAKISSGFTSRMKTLRLD